ncbi:MAG: hypothetical protein MJZ48_05025 [Paludibacteraceae bacterium]|nr:hypothetical protein [Paludibacteraceae bacterium]
MPNIVQIENCIYGKIKNVSMEQWLNMLKTHYNIERGFGVFMDDYVLLEQTDLRYEQGQLVYSERIVYNLNLTTKQPARVNCPSERIDAWEDNCVHYDAHKDRYIVQYIHYLCEDMPLVTNQLCEADMPIRGNSVQAPAEREVEPVRTSPVVNRPVIVNTPASPKAPTKTIEREVHFKRWRKHSLEKLKDLYAKGYKAWEIAFLMNVTEEGVRYQLTHSLGYTHLFTEPYWKPRKVETYKPANTPAPKVLKTWNELVVGDHVEHETYGRGYVASFRTNNGNKFIAIKYDIGIQKEYVYSESCINKFFTILTKK